MTTQAILEEYLHAHIPISAAMGVQVDEVSPSRIILKAPFSPNINHKKTVFGGSLHAVATLACWSLLHVNLVDVQIVITHSDVKYIAPVISEFKVECCMAHPQDWEYFIKMLQKKGKARLKLTARIFQEGQLCVDYTGTFVSIKTVNKLENWNKT